MNPQFTEEDILEIKSALLFSAISNVGKISQIMREETDKDRQEYQVFCQQTLLESSLEVLKKIDPQSSKTIEDYLAEKTGIEIGENNA